jgi:putative ABC transport system permease protein
MKHTLAMAFGSLLARPLRTLLTMTGIVLGVAVILAVSIANASTLDSVTSIFTAASGKANLVVLSAADDPDGFPERVRSTVLNAAGVEEAIPSLQVTVFMSELDLRSKRGISYLGESVDRLLVYGIDPTIDERVREYTIVEGSFLPPDLDAYEVVLVKDYADEKKIKVGDDVDFLTETGFATLRVTGLMSKKGAGQTNNGAFGVVPLGAVQDIYERGGVLDQIDVVAFPDYRTEIGVEGLRSALEARLGSEYIVTYPASQGKRVVQSVSLYQMGLSFFGAIAIIVGAFLIYNTFNMTVVERTREIGMLRTVGMTSRQVMAMITTESVVLGIVGGALGVGAGILLARGLIRVMEYLLAQPVRDVHVPLGGLATSVAVGLGVTLVASGIPAMQAGRISPLEALRVRGNPNEPWWVKRGWPWGIVLLCVSVASFYLPVPGSIRLILMSAAIGVMSMGALLIIPSTVRTWVQMLAPVLRRPFGGEGPLGARNIERAKQRTTMTVIALMVSIGMVYSIESMTASFRQDIDAWIEGFMGGDLYLYSSRPLRFDLGRRLEAVPGVAAATPMRLVDVKVVKADGSKDSLAYSAYDLESYQRVGSFVFADTKANAGQLMDKLAEGDVVFISTVVADKYGLQSGDSIRLQTRRGQRDFEVGAVVVDYNELGMSIQGSWKDLRRYFGVNDVSAFLVKLVPGAVHAQVRDDIDRLYGERQHLTIESNAAMKQEVTVLMAQTWGMFDVLAFIAVIVAALGVINTLMMSVLERTREIGMLRGVGMTRWQVVKLVLAEAAIIGVMGGVFAIVYGLFLSQIFIGGANTMQGYQLATIIPKQALVAGLFIAIIVSQVAALLPAFRAARLEVIEALQFE